MTELSEDHSTFPSSSSLVRQIIVGQTSEFDRSPLSHFMCHPLTPAQRDIMVMDRGEKLFKWWRLAGRDWVMNVLEMGLLVSSRNRARVRSSAVNTGLDTDIFTVCLLSLRPRRVLFPRPHYHDSGDMNQSISVHSVHFPSSELYREHKTPLHTFPLGGGGDFLLSSYILSSCPLFSGTN